MLTTTAAAMKVFVAFSLMNATPAPAPVPAATEAVVTTSRATVQDWAGAYTLATVDPQRFGPLVLHLLVERGTQGLLAVVIEDDGTSALSDVKVEGQRFIGTLKTTQGSARFDLQADGDRIDGTLTIAGRVLKLTGNRIN